MSQIEIMFIRHGEASEKWGDHSDPGLSDKGQLQASALLQHKELQNLKNYNFVSSPKLRAIQTAEPLSKKFDKEICIDETFIEIPSNNIDASEKQNWLKEIIECDRNNLPNFVKAWKKSIYEKTKSFGDNVVIFSHFMVINALLSELAKTEKLLYFFPDYTSVVKVIVKDGRFEYFLTEDDKKTSINL